MPVETTLYGESFWQACRKGVEQYQLFQAQGKLDVVEVQQAWQSYPPAPPAYAPSPLVLPGENQIKTAYLQDRTKYLQAQKAFLEEHYYKPLVANPNDLKLKNELATLLNWLGEHERAREIWKGILRL
jgi:hypothetical protein